MTQLLKKNSLQVEENIQRPTATLASPVVNSYNEWDPLEEVIVGVVEGSAVPEWHSMIKATTPSEHWDFFKKNGGAPFSRELIDAANRDLDELSSILESEGVKVVRPEPCQHAIPFSTPEWKSAGGLYQAMPRDLLLVIGNEIIETPMAWRARYFEIHAYRKLLKNYFKQGAQWTSAPRPQLSDELFNEDYVETVPGENASYAINDFEPTFDAADFIRCGRDIFAQKSNVTNQFGIDWLKKHLGPMYRIHVLDVVDSHPMHIDATFMPLAPGHLLVNPERMPQIPSMFKSWNIIYALPSQIKKRPPLYFTSTWINMNILMLDEKRVLVEREEVGMIELFKKNGFKPIPCNFTHFNSFGGAFHCATLDIRRRGKLESYFSGS